MPVLLIVSLKIYTLLIIRISYWYMDTFHVTNYRQFLRKKLESLPKQGFGQTKKMAEHLLVSSAFMSQVLNEKRDLTHDQLFLACEFLVLSELETKYLLKLVQFERASHHAYKKVLKKELEDIRKESKDVANRIQFKKVLSDSEKAIFYSDWYYSAIRMLSSIEPQTVESLMKKLGLPLEIVSEAIQFLLSSGLLAEEKNRYVIGALSTHLGADSPLVALHHANWRKKALEHVKMKSSVKIHYTSPMTLSLKDAEKIQALLLKAIEEAGKIVDPSPAEELMCLNLDWFRVRLVE